MLSILDNVLKQMDRSCMGFSCNSGTEIGATLVKFARIRMTESELCDILM